MGYSLDADDAGLSRTGVYMLTCVQVNLLLEVMLVITECIRWTLVECVDMNGVGPIVVLIAVI